MYKNFVITIGEQYLDSLNEIAISFTNAGLDINRIYNDIGVIIGRADEKSIDEIKNQKEIKDIREEKKIFISPPDSPIQ